MNIGESTSRFVQSLQSIERDIIARLGRAGVSARVDNFFWNRGGELVPPPATLSLEVVVQGRKASAVLTREHVEGYSAGQTGPAVAATIKEIVTQLSR